MAHAAFLRRETERREAMKVEIWDREMASGETEVRVDIDGHGCGGFANKEAAIECLHGKLLELQAAISTAVAMYLRQPRNPERKA
jgi:hypothetical protein